MKPYLSHSLLLIVGLLTSTNALAQDNGYSTDIELLVPTFSVDAIPGVDSPQIQEAGLWRTGLLGQFQADPLVLYDSGREIGAIVEQRYVAQLGLNYAIARNASIQVLVPGYFHNGTETPNFSAEGGGLGDLGLGMRFKAFDVGPLIVGARGDVTAPTGRKLAYMGEDGLRVGGSLLAQLDFGRVDVLVNAGAVLRQKVETEEDFLLGSEMIANGGVRVEPLKDRIWIFGGALNRGGFSNFWRPDAAENPLEAIGGIQFKPISPLQIDLGGGRGITDGYGTTQQRIFLGATWQFEKKEPEIIENDVVVEDVYIPEITVEEVLEQEQTWGENELARVIEQQIVIRDPIQFEFNTDRVLPESIPTLRFVAKLMNSNDRIGHVVIEGHASEEGSFEYNYDLSIRRARAVWEQLILAKVHPHRISNRGMGEVKPREISGAAAELLTEAELAENRRVEFKIVHQYGPLEIVPEYNTSIKVPWNGSDYRSAQPPANQAVNAGVPTTNEQNTTTPTTPTVNQNLFIDDEDEEEEAPTFDSIGRDGNEEGGGEESGGEGSDSPQE